MGSLARMRLLCSLLLLLWGQAAATLEAATTTKKSSIATTSRRLKGKVFVGAPGTYIGQDEEGHHATTTEGVVVGHFDDKNGTVTLDSEVTKEIGQEVEFMIEAAEHTAHNHNHQGTAPEEPTEEEDLLALTIGSFLGSFVPLSAFLYVIFRMVRPRIDVWVKNLEGSPSMADTFSDEGSLCTVDCNGDAAMDYSGDDLLEDDVNDHDESILSLSYGDMDYQHHESYSSATGDIFQDEEVDVDMLEDPCAFLNGIYDQGKNVADGDFLSYAKNYYERRSEEREEEQQQKQQQSSAATSNPITFTIRKAKRSNNEKLNSSWLSTSYRGSTTSGSSEEDHSESLNNSESSLSSRSSSQVSTDQKQPRRASKGGSSPPTTQQNKGAQPKASRRSKEGQKSTKKSLLPDWSAKAKEGQKSTKKSLLPDWSAKTKDGQKSTKNWSAQDGQKITTKSLLPEYWSAKEGQRSPKKSSLPDWSAKSKSMRKLVAGEEQSNGISPRSTRPSLGSRRSSTGSFARSASEHSSSNNSPATRRNRLGLSLQDGSGSSNGSPHSPLGIYSRRGHHEDGSRPMSDYSTGTFGARRRGYSDDTDEGLPLSGISSPNLKALSDWSTRRGSLV